MQTPLANAVKLANSQAAPKCQGWDADDPKGCWTHDMDRSAPIDYTEGFRLFENYDDAVAYGETLEGTFTHLARADESDLTPCFEQLRRFRDVLRQAQSAGALPGEVHVANSAALLVGEPLRNALPEATAVRPGLMLYGVRPAPHLAATLRPVMALRTIVQLVRAVRAGEPIYLVVIDGSINPAS